MDDGPTQIFVKFLGVAGLVAANGFFVAAELAFIGVRRSKIQALADSGNKAAVRLQKILNGLDDYISATQVGITIASLGLGWLAEGTLAKVLMSLFSRIAGTEAAATAHGAAVAASFTLITILHVVLGEQAPKIIALQSAERVALLSSRPMELFTALCRPAIFILNGMANRFVRLLGYKQSVATGHHLAYSEEELKIIVGISKKHGVLEASEEELIHSALEFTDRTVEEIMCPRPDMQMVPADMTLERLLSRFADSERSRYPVYQGTEDKIVGVLHVKDVLEQVAAGTEQDRRAQDIMRRPLFIPETRRLPDLLATLRREKTHMAIVLTEFGDVAGLVTMEDILEELVGEIQDEFDEPERRFEKAASGETMVQGWVPVGEVNEQFGLQLPEEEYNSIGGYVFGRLGRAPKVGDVVSDTGADFKVQAVDGFRVTRVIFIPRPVEEPQDATATE